MPLPNTNQPPLNPLDRDPVKNAQPDILPQRYQSAVIDTRNIRLTDIIAEIDGYRWQADEYFGQVLGADDEVTHYDEEASAVVNQYSRIKNLVLYVSVPLQPNFDNAVKEALVSGTATIMPFVRVNAGDLFIASSVDGRKGIYRVIQAIPKTMFKQHCKEIEYTQLGYVDALTDMLRDLNAKVVREMVYMEDYLKLGKDPLLTEKEVSVVKELKEMRTHLIDVYFNEFFDNQVRTFLLPEVEVPIYDHYLLRTVKAIVDSEEHTDYKRLLSLNVDGAGEMSSFTLWDMLIKMNGALMPRVAQKMWMISSKDFNRWPAFGSIYYSPLAGVVYPMNETIHQYPARGGESGPVYIPNPENIEDLVIRSILSGFGNVSDVDDQPAPQTPPLIHPVRKDNYYVLSNSFYKKIPGRQSKLELLINDVLDKKAINAVDVLTVCQGYHTWEPLDRFYYKPLLLILIHIALKTI